MQYRNTHIMYECTRKHTVSTHPNIIYNTHYTIQFMRVVMVRGTWYLSSEWLDTLDIPKKEMRGQKRLPANFAFVLSFH